MSKQEQQGFTLLEVLIALSILTIGSLAVFALMHRTILATESNKNSIIAVNLAREGVELVRSIRDSNSSGMGFSALTNGDYILDSENLNLDTQADNTDINSCGNCSLYMSAPPNRRYSHDSAGTDTGMKRLIYITDGSSVACISSPCEKVITVEVLQPGLTQPYTLITHLTDWR